MKRLVPFLLAVFAPALALADVTSWNIDPAHTEAAFAVKHLVISTVRGEFRKTTGTVKLDEQDPTRSVVEATIEVGSIDTREPKRDDHLRSPDFFEAAKHPTITFKSTKIEKSGDRYKVAGELTMRGTTKPVVLDASLTPEIKDPWGMTRRGVQATARVNRQDFGLAWSKAIEAGPVVGDEVAIEINAELIKQAPEQKAAEASQPATPAAKAQAGKKK